MAQTQKWSELFSDIPDEELLLPSQVASIFGITTEALKGFTRTGRGPLPVLADLKIRYRVGDVRAFYRSEEFQEWIRECDESQKASKGEWKELFLETFSNRDLPDWFVNEMRGGLREAAKQMIPRWISEQMAQVWKEEFEQHILRSLPQKVFEKAEAEAAKHLGRYAAEVLMDPKIQGLIHERAVGQIVARIEQHPAMRELTCLEVDQDRVRAAMVAVTQVDEEKGWVYLVQGGNHSDLKIGKASSLAGRLSNHRSSNPHLRLVASFRGYTALESRLHEVFHPYRMAAGEWFIFSLTIQEFLRQAFEAGLALRPEVTGPYGENEKAALAGAR